MITKITLDELNLAYTQANKFKMNGYPTRSFIEVEVDRNPLVATDSLNIDGKIKTKIKLKFELDNNLGTKGSYVLVSNVDVIDID